mmetsp:Transcript_74359/g.168433  ORF Transcript_74359/g.168433 Transcript_74359/m.168433 type:complete len:147 (-) Transcript_74359:87-527(-)
MSLLCEPYNKAACDRNEKERKLLHGELRQKTREDYLLQHIGLTRDFQVITPGSQSPSKSRRRRAPSEGTGTPLRVVSSPFTTGSVRSRSSSASALPRPASRGSLASSEPAEPRLRTPPQDPLIQVMMKGPPLFSPNFCSAASKHII